MLLKISELSVLTADNKPAKLLRDVSFNLPEGAVYTVTGRNGSGKSTLLKSITGLLDKEIYKVSGDVLFEGKNLLTLKENQLNKIRQSKIKYVLQDTINSYDPLKKIGYYFRKFLDLENSNLDDLLAYFMLPPKKELSRFYPYELSGGMAQKLSVIMALQAKPELLIMDEPTSSLDSPIVNLLLHKLKEFISAGNRSVLLVTQDLTFAKAVSTQIAVLNNNTLSPFYEPKDFFDPDNILPETIVESYRELQQ